MFDSTKRVCNATYLQKDVQHRPKNWTTSSYRIAGKVAWTWTIRLRSGRLLITDLVSYSTTTYWKFLGNGALNKKKQHPPRISRQWTKRSGRTTVTCSSRHPGTTFEKEIQQQSETHENPNENENAHIDECLKRMNTCLQKTIELNVPNKKRLSTIKRAPSERTHALYEAKTQKYSKIIAQGGTVPKQLRKLFENDGIRRYAQQTSKTTTNGWSQWWLEWKKQIRKAIQRPFFGS